VGRLWPITNWQPALRKSESLSTESGCRGWFEFRDAVLEGLLEVWVVLVGMLADELEDLAIAVGGLFVLAASLVHHSQPVIAVMYFRIAFQ
jgi:hypothetical protein